MNKEIAELKEALEKAEIMVIGDKKYMDMSKVVEFTEKAVEKYVKGYIAWSNNGKLSPHEVNILCAHYFADGVMKLKNSVRSIQQSSYDAFKDISI